MQRFSYNTFRVAILQLGCCEGCFHADQRRAVKVMFAVPNRLAGLQDFRHHVPMRQAAHGYTRRNWVNICIVLEADPI
jgi:hypothetical protein